MQKKRWIFYDGFCEEVNKCRECDLLDTFLFEDYLCGKTLIEVTDVEKIDEDCPLIEAETGERALQKIREVFGLS